jgi:hypothetical protein
MWKEGHGAGVVNQHNPAALQSPARPRHSERPSQSRLAQEIILALLPLARTQTKLCLDSATRKARAPARSAVAGRHRATACIVRRRLLRRRTRMPLPRRSLLRPEIPLGDEHFDGDAVSRQPRPPNSSSFAHPHRLA